MKKYTLLFMVCLLTLVSCDDYLDVLPKGKRLPKTMEDYELLLRNNSLHVHPQEAAAILLNDITTFFWGGSLNWKKLYDWNENINRISGGTREERGLLYNTEYAHIAVCNIIINNIDEAEGGTEAEKNTIKAYARVLRALSYFQVVNYYADTYDPATAGTKLGVPLILKDGVGGLPYTQPTIQGIYDFILSEMKDVVIDNDYIPAQSPTIYHPDLGCCYAFLAKVYLQMSDYENALTYADKALEQNDELFDWVAFYRENIDWVENREWFEYMDSPEGLDFVENYNFAYNSGDFIGEDIQNPMPRARAEKFEMTNDARFMMCWGEFEDLAMVTSEEMLDATVSGFINWGMKTPEIYLIKAECLARAGRIGDAMDVVNQVRRSRVVDYEEWTASTQKEAIEKIRRVKDNETIGTLVPFMDARRFNLDPEYARTMKKTAVETVYDEETGEIIETTETESTLLPDSFLWTFPFPMEVMNNQGGGKITQNVDK